MLLPKSFEERSLEILEDLRGKIEREMISVNQPWSPSFTTWVAFLDSEIGNKEFSNPEAKGALGALKVRLAEIGKKAVQVARENNYNPPEGVKEDLLLELARLFYDFEAV